jgi:hypothetical protein
MQNSLTDHVKQHQALMTCFDSSDHSVLIACNCIKDNPRHSLYSHCANNPRSSWAVANVTTAFKVWRWLATGDQWFSSHPDSKAGSCTTSLSLRDKPMLPFTQLDSPKEELTNKDENAKKESWWHCYGDLHSVKMEQWRNIWLWT